MTPTCQEASDSCAVVTRYLYRTKEWIAPKLRDHRYELRVATGGRGHVVHAKSDTSPVNGHCHMLVFVSVEVR